jgi:hypothetical protein
MKRSYRWVLWMLAITIPIAQFGIGRYKIVRRQSTSELSGLISSTTNFQVISQPSKPQQETFTTAPPVLAPPLDHPPLSIIAGAWVYHVRFTTKQYLTMNECDGYTDYKTHEVWLRRGDRNLRDTVMHELMHIAKHMADEDHITWSGPTTGFNANHDYIEPAAPEMLSILAANPSLVRWLTADPHTHAEGSW